GRADLGDASAERRVAGAPEVWSGSSRRLLTDAHGRERAAEAALRDVEIPVRSKRQPTGVVEAGCEDRDRRRGSRLPVAGRRLPRCLRASDEPRERSDCRDEETTPHTLSPFVETCRARTILPSSTRTCGAAAGRVRDDIGRV